MAGTRRGAAREVPGEVRRALAALLAADPRPPRDLDSVHAALRRRLGPGCSSEEAERLVEVLQALGLIDAPQGIAPPEQLADPARFITASGRRLLDGE